MHGNGYPAAAAASCLDQNRVVNEMQPDAVWGLPLVKMSPDCVADLLLQILKVPPLRSNATRVVGSVPRGYQPARVLVVKDLERDFIHQVHNSG